MTERGLPLADGAPACPFVAFDDDRDERASVPDHRHRCFADTRPSPRALAHQEAYCLSSAFPVCPTFQDWARREAARSRGGAATAPGASAGMNRAATGAVADAEATRGSDAADDEVQDRHDDDTSHEDDARDGRDDHTSHEDDARDRRSPADPYAPSGDDLVRRNPPRDWAAPPPWLASSEGRRNDEADPPAFLGRRVSEPGQGLAGSPADRMAGGPPPSPRRVEDDGGDWSSESRSAAAMGADLASAGAAPAARHPSPPARNVDDERDEHDELDEPGEPRTARRPRAYAQHLGGPDGPDWERPRRYEAYPVIKSRVAMPGIPAIPRTLGLFGILILAAVALLVLPTILNFGGSTPPPAGSPGASLPPGPSASLAPTEVPAATPIVYTIKKGDVLSKIATQHGITIEELMAANPTIKNPNRISEGQQIVIPAPSAPPPDTIGGSGAP